jgi:hypothetical protein
MLRKSVVIVGAILSFVVTAELRARAAEPDSKTYETSSGKSLFLVEIAA